MSGSMFSQWFNDRDGETVSIGLSNGFAVTGVCEGTNADDSAVFLLVGIQGREVLYNLAHIISASVGDD